MEDVGVDVAVAVGEVILSALLKRLIENVSSYELHKFAKEKHLHGELEKLKTTLQKIQEVLNDAEDKQMTEPSVKKWLRKLQDLAYDADDLLDEFSTEALSKMIKRKSVSSVSKVLRVPSLWNNMEMGCRIKKITARLKEIVAEKDAFGLRRNVKKRSENLHYRETTSLEEPKVFGRDSDKEVVVKLLQDSSANFSVISIVGMGGVGKTTLAQSVYNDKRVVFDRKAWVCVSDIFDVGSISKVILSKLGASEANDLDSNQIKLKERLSGKKFLIILDDVWNEDYEKWTTLCKPFFAGAPGSIIIVTTRSEDVSSMVGSAHTYKLKGLSDDDCLLLFALHALGVENFDQHPNLKEIGQKIANRCEGLPLVAKILGGLMRGERRVEKWQYILENLSYHIFDNTKGILQSLLLSYHHLPSHLKQCFAFCGVFPKDYEFSVDELVLLWMAEGFLHSMRQERMDVLGHIYFESLVSRSFFQQSAGDKSKYVMHDLISDLAQFVSKGISVNLDNKVEGENVIVRHLAFTRHEYDISERFEILHQMNGLRMLLSLQGEPWRSDFYLSGKVINDLVPKLKALRVLSLAGYCIAELPTSIADLKHLRLLDLSNSRIETLPNFLCKLCNMQTLILLKCSKLIRLPEGFSNLINLHHLDLRDTPKLQEMPLGMSNLVNLSTLSKFVVGKDKGLGIGELKKLSHLQGHISLERLDNVVHIQDAEDANLKGKHDLNDLRLEWSSTFNESRDKSHEEQVLIAVQPSQNIRKLTISYYGGTSFPSWVGDIRFENMVFLELRCCRNVTSMPPLGELTSLKDLVIHGMNEIKELGSEFYGKISCQSKVLFQSLESLKIYDMSNLEKWSNGPIEETITKFGNLRELILQNCPQLVGMYPGCLPSLKQLEIKNCEKLVEWSRSLPMLSTLTVDECNEILLKNVPSLSSLTCCRIERINGLEHLNKEIINSWRALEDISIYFCDDLKYFSEGEDLRKLSCLKKISVVACKEFTSLSGRVEEDILLCSLQKLKINGSFKFTKLPKGFKYLTHLSSLKIYRCPELQEFPEGGLPSSITHLRIKSCASLKALPQEIMNNVDANISSPNLRSLCIEGCDSLVVSPDAHLPQSLQYLIIPKVLSDAVKRSSPNLTSLAKLILLGGNSLWPLSSLTSLQFLRIHGLSVESFPERCLPPNLSSLEIDFCENLSTLSIESLSIESCENLSTLSIDSCKNLSSLSIDSCENLSTFSIDSCKNLSTLEIQYCENLKQPMSEWGLHRLTSLKELKIRGPNPATDAEVSFPHLQLPPSLTHIVISKFNNLKSISNDIHHLTSLKMLHIWDCPNFQRLPKRGLPPTLYRLQTNLCPLLKVEKFLSKYGHVIANVPYIQINDCKIGGGKVVDDEMYGRFLMM